MKILVIRLLCNKGGMLDTPKKVAIYGDESSDRKISGGGDEIFIF
jgi:hypothetical protein